MGFTTRTIGKVKVLELSGSFDRFNVQIVHQCLEEATAQPPAHIVLNLKAVDLLDSSALAALVYGVKRARLVNGDLRLCCLQRSTRLLFEMTRMDKVFEIFLFEADAIQAFADVEQYTQVPQHRYTER
jgi:anti-anti-sigma factor